MTVELRGLKGFKGHEGEPLFQSNIYMNGKKIGDWSDDSWGGPMAINFKDASAESSFTDFAKTILAVEKDYSGEAYDVQGMSDYEIRSSALMHLSTREVELMQLKKEVKKGIVYYRKNESDFTGKSMYVWKVPYTQDNA